MNTKAGGSPPRRGLAKGLSALLADVDSDAYKAAAGVEPTTAPIEFLKPCPLQPRRRFDEDSIAALAASIRSKGILQPLIVRPDSQYPGSFEIIAGERRWRAAQVAQLHELPIVVHDLSDREALEVGLVENIQRADLTPIEEGSGYRKLIDEFGHSQAELATIIGKSRSHIANSMRLLGLPEAVKAMVDDGRLSAGHARALLAADQEAPTELAEMVVLRGLNVRQTEALLRKGAARPGRVRAPAQKDANTLALERSLSDCLDLSVAIDHRGPGGTVSIRYESLAELDDFLRRLGAKE